MNQILQVKETKSVRKLIDTKKIIMFFMAIIIIFGLSIGGYVIYQNLINGNIVIPGIIEVPKYTPTINLTQTEENQLIINVESQIELAKITYNWNNEEVQTIELEGKTNIEKTIDIPLGENVFYITTIDINGEETKKQENFLVEAPKPKIELSVVGNDIKITVTSEVELEKVTYEWNSENKKEINMLTYKDRTKYEKKLEIPIGQHTLKIVAIDIDGGQSEKTQEIKGITKATTQTTVKDGYWHFTITGKENIKTVEFEFNGQKYLMNTETFGETKKVHYKVELVEGINYLTVTSTTESGGVDTSSWEEHYTEK